MDESERVSTYKVKGLTCANCAERFERNVNSLSEVKGASVNFAAEKLIVHGNVKQEELEKAGSFDQISLSSADNQSTNKTEPFWRDSDNIPVFIAALFTLLGGIFWALNGEEHWLTILTFLLAIVIGGYDLFLQGFKNLFSLVFDMKTLMTIAITGAVIIGEWGEGALVVILFAISEALERYSMDQSRKSLRALIKEKPVFASIQKDNDEKEVPIGEVEVGDRMIVRPGQKVALDGEVLNGESTLNQAAITGESMPVPKKAGDSVYAGTLNEEGMIEVKVTKKEKDSSLAKIIHLVEEAQGKKAPAQKFIDRFAYYYTPAVIVLAIAIMTVPPLFLNGAWGEWVYLGLATLVVGCPCALVISTPVAIVTAIGKSARQGILLKGGIHLEQMSQIDTIAFDKTGTLTAGKPVMTDYIVNKNVSEPNFFKMVTELEKYSTHPLAKAVVNAGEQFLQGENRESSVKDIKSITGRGMKGCVEGAKLAVGNPSYIRKEITEGLPIKINERIQQLEAEGKTVILASLNQEWIGIMAFRDELRKDAKETVEALMSQGMNAIYLLSGDQHYTTAAIAKAAGISDMQAKMLPEDKNTFILRLREEGGKVAMIGDGVNDAPALASAHVGIAMGGAGTDTALETASITLMGDDLTKLPYLIDTSRKTITIIKQNIVFALGLKAAALLLVPFGLLTLWIAIVADMGATLLVTLNSLRVMRKKKL